MGWWTLLVLVAAGGLSACTGGRIDETTAASLNIIAADPAGMPYAVSRSTELIGGPQAEGRPGDVVLQNDLVRVVIRQQGRYPGVGSFGGTIIDADRVRGGGAPGHDQFGVMLPLINMEWTLNAMEMMAFREFDLDRYFNGELAPLGTRETGLTNPVVVVRSVIDVYPFLDVDFLEPLAKALTGQSLYFSPHFDDVNDPFAATELRQVRLTAFTEYRLPAGARHVEIRTTLFNDGETDVRLPVGDFVNGSGELQLLIPGLGFSPALLNQVTGDTPAIVYAGQAGIDVSYGYFYQLRDFLDVDGKRRTSSSVSYSGVTGILLGENLAKVLPLGGGTATDVQFAIPAHGRRTIARYFVIGDGSAGAVFDEGLRVLQIPTKTINGRVVDGQGNGVADAHVAVLNETGNTIVTYRTDGAGRFSGRLSVGGDSIADAFGNGRYTLRVEKPGYHETGSDRAGHCLPDTIDLQAQPFAEVQCVLGGGGALQFAGPMRDAAGAAVPVRVMLLGVDPSPDRSRPGQFTDTVINERSYGVVQVCYLNAAGRIDASDATTLRVEPGEYRIVYSRGPEYEQRVEPLQVAGYGFTTVTPGVLRRVVPTVGYVSGDFHIHASPSPDSAVSVSHRAIAAAGEGLDVLHSSDHDFLFDYAPIVAELEQRGWVRTGQLGTVVGDEISPNHLGHIHAFPLDARPEEPAGGALDWSLAADPRGGPAPEQGGSVQEILDRVRASRAGEMVLQVNHISDQATSLLSISGLTTTTAYLATDGVAPLSVFSDPMMARLPYAGPADLPMPWGTSPHTSGSFTAVELTIGSELAETKLLESALPQWFNLLNLGMLLTATADSDSHTTHRPIGLPRNLVRSDVDPADRLGDSLRGMDIDAYARAINDHHVIISAGPFVQMTARSEDGGIAEVGDLLRARRAVIRVDVTAPSWAWFDTIELFANTEPTPVDDDNFGIMRGVAEHAATFQAPYHIPHYIYEPVAQFRLHDGTLKSWSEKDGVIRATIEYTMELNTDTWVVAMVRGTPETKGYRPLFPMVVHGVAEEGKQPTLTPPWSLATLQADPHLSIAPAWALTNPIFLDTDGDTNNDGRPFEALHIKRGTSPLR